MTGTDWTAIIAIFVSIISAIVALLSRTDSRRSANASEASAEVAKQALKLEQNKFLRDAEEAKLREKKGLIESGKSLLKEHGNRGFKNWFHAHPEIFERDDWFVIVKAASAQLGFRFKDTGQFFDYMKERQIPIPEGVINGKSNVSK